MSSMIATPASVSLMNGLDKAKNRFWFNIKKIEDKYAERERSGIPESLVEMDGEGNVYYPESMTALQQQSYINRMYQREIQFGKGSISAPQNSIDSFEGDVRAMREAKKSDQQFGKRFRKFHFSDSSGYDGEISLRSNSLSTGGMPMGKSEMLEDNSRNKLLDMIPNVLESHFKQPRQFQDFYFPLKTSALHLSLEELVSGSRKLDK
uniref:Uncharacterized protein n=1 Tax=Caenorhabditis japonica TaxID=281687 RepID=A0A8R1IE61_CAEJA